MLGKTEVSEFSPLQFLVDDLNSAAYRGEAFPFLVELARDGRGAVALCAHAHGTKDEKIGLARVMARSGEGKHPHSEAQQRSGCRSGPGRPAGGSATRAGPELKPET